MSGQFEATILAGDGPGAFDDIDKPRQSGPADTAASHIGRPFDPAPALTDHPPPMRFACLGQAQPLKPGRRKISRYWKELGFRKIAQHRRPASWDRLGLQGSRRCRSGPGGRGR